MTNKRFLPCLLLSLAAAAIALNLFNIFKLVGMSPCQSCTFDMLLIPIVGIVYFLTLIPFIFFFPTQPSASLKCYGIVFSAGLFIILYFLSPKFCVTCLIAHIGHVAFWLFWKPQKTSRKEIKP